MVGVTQTFFLWRPASGALRLAILALLCIALGLRVAGQDLAPPASSAEAGNDASKETMKKEGPKKEERPIEEGFHWGPALGQSLLFTTVMHGFRLTTEPSTRAELRGPFFKDYWASVKGLRGWRDGDETYVNYVGHPIQGAISGFIQIQNDPRGRRQEIGRNKKYWESRLKAMGWAAVVSLQFELGPLSEASIGNVGQWPSEKSKHPMGYVDLVITPVLGTTWLVGEDFLDRHVIRRIESLTRNRIVLVFVRGLLNPARSSANMLRLKPPWHRDNRPL